MLCGTERLAMYDMCLYSVSFLLIEFSVLMIIRIEQTAVSSVIKAYSAGFSDQFKMSFVILYHPHVSFSLPISLSLTIILLKTFLIHKNLNIHYLN